MVAVPKEDRVLKHVSKPLKYQMYFEIDRTRWPVLITYSDEGQGHTGYVYKCSGWRPTLRSKRPVYENDEGVRTSSYSNGAHGVASIKRAGDTIVQRWEHWIGNPPDRVAERFAKQWVRTPVEGKTWRSGAQAYTYVKAAS